MKQVIESGNLVPKITEIVCDKCKCKFSFEESDIETEVGLRVVTCPECNNPMILGRAIDFSNRTQTINLQYGQNNRDKEVEEGNFYEHLRSKDSGEKV